jgi:hypothetical protein
LKHIHHVHFDLCREHLVVFAVSSQRSVCSRSDFPQLLGNGKGLAQAGFENDVGLGLADVMKMSMPSETDMHGAADNPSRRSSRVQGTLEIDAGFR